MIGESGSGKSTLLKLLAAAESPDAGQITVRFPGGTGHLPQPLALSPDHTVRDAVDLALADLRDMERRLRAAEKRLSEASEAELSAYGELLLAYEERGGYEADVRVDAALHGLGLAGISRDRVLGSLSGGEQSRLALACVPAAAPELLLLDEPTNHLDAAAAHWLEEHLRARRGTVVAVTHDRAFPERVDHDPGGRPGRAHGLPARRRLGRTGQRGGWPPPAVTRSRGSADTAAPARRNWTGRCARSGCWSRTCGVSA